MVLYYFPLHSAYFLETKEPAMEFYGIFRLILIMQHQHRFVDTDFVLTLF